MNRESIEEGLLANRYDISVLLTSNILNSALTTETLLRSIRRLWVPAQHPLLKRVGVGLRDIAEEPYIMLTVDEAAYSSLKYWSTTPYQPRVMLRTSSIEAVRSMVANSLGVAILSRYGAPPLVAGGPADRDRQYQGSRATDGRWSRLARQYRVHTRYACLSPVFSAGIRPAGYQCMSFALSSDHVSELSCRSRPKAWSFRGNIFAV